MCFPPSVRIRTEDKYNRTHKQTHHGTHVICVIFWKASGGTDVIPLYSRKSQPPCVGQEPVRTSGAPAWSPLKVQPPKATVHGWDSADRRCLDVWDFSGRRCWCDISWSGNLPFVKRSSLNRDLDRKLAAG